MTTNKKARFEDLYPIIAETVKQGNCFSFCAFGNSMLPYIRNGKDLVFLGPVRDAIRKNDIIFYRRKSGQFVLHRVVKVHNNKTLDLCGDNQYQVEKGITDDQVIAKLIKIERDGKTILPTSFSARLFCFFLPLRRFFLHVKRSITHRIRKFFQK